MKHTLRFREEGEVDQDVWERAKHGRGDLFTIHTKRKSHLPPTQVLFQLKFTSKQLEKMSKKAEKDQHKEEASNHSCFVNNDHQIIQKS